MKYRFSDGGRHACWLASQNLNVGKLILVSTSAFVSEREKRIFAQFKDITLWSDEKRRVFQNIYGFDGLKKNFHNFVNEFSTLRFIIPPEVLQGIKCPTLILHADRDLLDLKHAHYLNKRIQNSKLCIFKTNHDILKNKHLEINHKIHEFLSKDNQPLDQVLMFYSC